MATDGVKPDILISKIVQTLDSKVHKRAVEFFASGFDAMLQLYSEAFRKDRINPHERQAQLAIAAGRLAAFCEGASNFFAIAAVEHTGTDEHAHAATTAAIPVVEAMLNRKIAQWAEEADRKVN